MKKIDTLSITVLLGITLIIIGHTTNHFGYLPGLMYIGYAMFFSPALLIYLRGVKKLDAQLRMERAYKERVAKLRVEFDKAVNDLEKKIKPKKTKEEAALKPNQLLFRNARIDNWWPAFALIKFDFNIDPMDGRKTDSILCTGKQHRLLMLMKDDEYWWGKNEKGFKIILEPANDPSPNHNGWKVVSIELED